MRFAPVEDPRGLLKDLVTLYHASQAKPVPLLGKPSWVFAANVVANKAERALENAKKAHEKYGPDPYARFAWGKAGPFADETWAEGFKLVSLSVYEPLFRHRSVG